MDLMSPEVKGPIPYRPHEGVWWATGAEIAEEYLQHMGLPS